MFSRRCKRLSSATFVFRTSYVGKFSKGSLQYPLSTAELTEAEKLRASHDDIIEGHDGAIIGRDADVCFS